MRRYELVSYTYRPRLTGEDLRALTQTFTERGTNPGVISHYQRLDGRGGFVVQEVESEEGADAAFERTMAYSELMDFEVLPITTMEDALPTILKLYG